MSGAKRAKLTYREVAKAIADRTGLPENMTKAFIDAYSDIVKEAIIGQVEVPFGDICIFGWKQINPRENVVTYNHFTHDFNEPVDVEGFLKMSIRANKNWSKELRRVTRFDMGEENPVLSGNLRYSKYIMDETDLEDEEEGSYGIQGDDDNE